MTSIGTNDRVLVASERGWGFGSAGSEVVVEWR
jgi:hypothetical protein